MSMLIRKLSWAATLALTTAAACSSRSDFSNPDRCFILVAQVSPADPHLQVGDTVTMRAAFSHDVSPDCLPSDTTAAALRWESSNGAALTIDPGTGLLTARAQGVTQVIVRSAHGGEVLGTTFATVP